MSYRLQLQLASSSVLILLASCQQTCMTYTIAVRTVKETTDDGQRNCPKHVEFYSKNKFEKLVHLVGFIIGMEGDCRFTFHNNVYWRQMYQTTKGKLTSVYTIPYFDLSHLWATHTSTTFNLVSALQYNDTHCTGFPHYNQLSHICLPINHKCCPKMNFIAAHVMDGKWERKLASTLVNRNGFVTWPPSLVLPSPAHCSTGGQEVTAVTTLPETSYHELQTE